MEEFQSLSECNLKTSKDHFKLIGEVCQLNKKQRVSILEHDELANLTGSENHLIQSCVTNANGVKTSALMKSLHKKNSQTKIGKLIKASTDKLPKILEKHTVEKIKREIGFDNLKKELQKWNAVVAQNKIADNLSFPLNHKFMNSQPTDDFVKRYRIQSDIEKDLFLLEHKAENIDKEKTVCLSSEEVLQRKAEIAKSRAQQSYKLSKECRRKRIKSKKFHRIEKKNRLKNELKGLDELKKIDPLAALEKLKYLEKVRSEERMTLRHKNTGHWARNKLIRAKYDKESRQKLNEQLSLGRDATQKILKTSNLEDGEENMSSMSVSNTFTENPWINMKIEPEVTQFINQYKHCNIQINKGLKENNEISRFSHQSKSQNDTESNITCKPMDGRHCPVSNLNNQISLPYKSSEVHNSKRKNAVGTTTWVITNLDHIAENSDCEKQGKSNIEETEKPFKDNQDSSKIDKNKFKNIKTKNLKTLLPDLNSVKCEVLHKDENEEKANRYCLLYEAFSDQDVVEEFRKEKETEVMEAELEDANIKLPGWGSWGGNNIKQILRRKQKFITKLNKDIMRKDENKGNVIIIQENNADIKKHQISELPFPFSNVKDHEASIRTPIGRNFIPEKSHRMLIRPSVRTKMGKVIEPMDEDSLLNTSNLKQVK